MGGTPVRWLEFMSRLLKFLSADHEGGSAPAHPQLAFSDWDACLQGWELFTLAEKEQLAKAEDAPVRLLVCK